MDMIFIVIVKIPATSILILSFVVVVVVVAAGSVARGFCRIRLGHGGVKGLGSCLRGHKVLATWGGRFNSRGWRLFQSCVGTRVGSGLCPAPCLSVAWNMQCGVGAC